MSDEGAGLPPNRGDSATDRCTQLPAHNSAGSRPVAKAGLPQRCTVIGQPGPE
ncbi:hypothetical protein [Streptomyces yerevanensis]|uniref:hypothetical protein n=1 Tax=Streptomyces yerevanensis TaxID=66378 RepID=UPI0012FEF8C6|nr:hypothetical protein [Streptomyces yerevanensis]